MCCATTEASAFALLAFTLLFSLWLWTTAAVHYYVSSFSLSSLLCHIQSNRVAVLMPFFFFLPSLTLCRRRTNPCASLFQVVYACMCVCVCVLSFLFLLLRTHTYTHIQSSIDRLDVVCYMAVYVCACVCKQTTHREGTPGTTTMHAYTLRQSILLLLPP
jgi:hypothetical protein